MMIHKFTLKSLAAAAALLIGVAVSTTGAKAADSCFEVGENFAAQNGVSVVAAKETSQNGQAMCEVVILRQASNGNRPKREVVYLPR